MQAMTAEEQEAFFGDLAAVSVQRVHASMGIDLESWQEYTIHEYAHLAVLRYTLPYDPFDSVERVIEYALRGNPSRVENELKTVAAEVLVIRALGRLRDEQAFLWSLERAGSLHGLAKRVWRKLHGRRWRIAEQDATEAIRLIREHAKQARANPLRRLRS